MGKITAALNITVVKAPPLPQSQFGAQRSVFPDFKYQTLAKEGYSSNELVFACIEELSTSAAEPRMMIRKNGAEQWTHEGHRLLELLERPNPFMDRFEFFATVIMHRSIAGNAYAWIGRTGSGRPVELWILRPDRMRVVPDATKHISHYEYDIGTREPIRLPVDDVIHWKTRNPLSDYYGMPPLMAAAGRVDIDNFAKEFVKTYFQRAGVPSAMLNVKGKMPDEVKKEIVSNWHENSGAANWHGLLVVDNTEASFTPMTANLGSAGLMLPDIDEISEARIAMVFQVPLGLVGARLGMASSSYANRASDRQSFWDETLAPLYKAIAGPMNLRLRPNYPDVSEIAFDLSDVKALQEDIDRVHARVRADVNGGLVSMEEGRVDIGKPQQLPTGHTFMIPGNMTAMPTADVGKPIEPPETAVKEPSNGSAGS